MITFGNVDEAPQVAVMTPPEKRRALLRRMRDTAARRRDMMAYQRLSLQILNTNNQIDISC